MDDPGWKTACKNHVTALIAESEKIFKVRIGYFEVGDNIESIEDYFTWVYLAKILTLLLPHVRDSPPTEESILVSAISKRAFTMTLGPHGFVQGWTGRAPNIEFVKQCILRKDEAFLREVWDFNDDTDGDSSYRADSPTYVDSKFEEPLFPDMSSDSTDGNSSKQFNNDRKVETYLNEIGVNDVEIRQDAKQLNDFLARYNRQRRVRRKMRRERRLARQCSSQTEKFQPVFNLEAKRAEILASERNKLQPNVEKYHENKNNQLINEILTPQPLLFANPSINLLPIRLPNGRFDKEVALMHLHALRNVLRTQIINSWLQFYGNQRKLDADEKLNCWISPVRFVRQTGPNCGLAALAMAMRSTLTCEVMVGGAADGGGSSDVGVESDPEVTENVLAITKWSLEMMRKLHGPHSYDASLMMDLDERNLDEIYLNVPTLDQIQHDAIMRGYTGRGEMFSSRCMALLARSHLEGRHIVRLVKRDLLEDNMKFPKPCPNSDLQADNVTATEYGISWLLSVVDRLMRGFLIAVSFDCDKNMMPGWTQGGSQAHWGLLCGVVVLSKDNELTENHYFKPNLNLERDADRVWVVARHGKMSGPRYALWSLRELAYSNRQLRTPSDKILQTNETIKRSGLSGGTIQEPRMNIASGGLEFSGETSQEQTVPKQGSVAPPLPPPPPILQSMIEQQMEIDDDTELPPFIFPDGTCLDKTLARQYVSFEPMFPPNLINKNTKSFDNIISDPLSPVLYHFSYKSNEYSAEL